MAERSKANRLSSSITNNMYQECQEMLQMFCLSWLVAPGEAEAQCAQLDTAGLTEGTITDYSNIWLFGGGGKGLQELFCPGEVSGVFQQH